MNSYPQPLLPTSLEELNGSLMTLGRAPRAERAEIASTPRFRIRLTRVQPIAAVFELANHLDLLSPNERTANTWALGSDNRAKGLGQTRLFAIGARRARNSLNAAG